MADEIEVIDLSSDEEPSTQNEENRQRDKQEVNCTNVIGIGIPQASAGIFSALWKQCSINSQTSGKLGKYGYAGG